MNNEDKIIADGLMFVREGILKGDMQKVCDGYNSISGEELSPPAPQEKPKSRLESIREQMGLQDSPLIMPDEVSQDEDDDDDDPTDEEGAPIISQIGTEEIKAKDFTGERDVTIQHITVPYDDKQAKRNKASANKKIALPPVKRTNIKELEGNETKEGTRLHMKKNTPNSSRWTPNDES